MCNFSKGLRVSRFSRVLSFEEGDEWGPVIYLEKAHIALRVSDSEHGYMLRLTHFGYNGVRL